MHTVFCIADGRTCFYQWDVNQKMLVMDETIKELHFCNGTSDCSLVCKVQDGKANVPNILLQSARSISVYGYTGDHTKIQKIFRVNPRTKPEDYVYTETEIKSFSALEKRVEDIEKGLFPGGNFSEDHAGKLVFIGADGTLLPLTLGNEFEIRDGVLRIKGQITHPDEPGSPDEPEPPVEVVLTVDQDGNATLSGATLTVALDGAGTITDAAVSVDDNGNGMIE